MLSLKWASRHTLRRTERQWESLEVLPPPLLLLMLQPCFLLPTQTSLETRLITQFQPYFQSTQLRKVSTFWLNRKTKLETLLVTRPRRFLYPQPSLRRQLKCLNRLLNPTRLIINLTSIPLSTAL